MFDDVILPDTIEEAPLDDTPEPVVQAAPPELEEESDKARNMRFLRESKNRAERERDDAYRRLEDMERSRKPVQDPEDPEPSPDDLVEWKHVSKKIKNLESQIKNQQQHAYESATEVRLRTQFQDFDKVVNNENIEILRSTHPEIAETLSESTNVYNKFASAYKIIKNLGIGESKSDPYEADRARAQRNAAKPKPLASVSPQQGDSPLSNANAFANGLTDELRKQLFKEMTEIRKGY